MKAYKATNKNMTCRELQYELNKEFIHEGEIKMCANGIHFCETLEHVFNYYAFCPQTGVFEVEIPDDAIVIKGDDKSVTNKIKFVKELTNEENMTRVCI